MTVWKNVLKRRFSGFGFVLPVLIFLLLFVTYPIISNTILSFTNSSNKFVGLDNFKSVFADDTAVFSIINSLLYVGASVIGQLIIGTWAGILLNREFKGKGVARSAVLIPWVIPGAVAATTWAWMYHSDYGIISHIFMELGILSDRGPLAMPGLVMPALILVNVWKMFPFVAVMVLAGLKGIEQSLFEAADVDGASLLQKLWYITIPQLRPILTTLLLLLTIWGFNSITLIYTMTGGGPANLSMILPIHIFQQTFQYYNLNKAAAESIILFFVLLIIIVMYMRTLTEKDAR
jgi:multiple sugar transport system permease protein